MEHDAKLNKARILAWEGISRARVTQVMDLLELPAEIQAGLLRPGDFAGASPPFRAVEAGL